MAARTRPIVDVGVLGAIRVAVEATPVAVGGPRQRAVLARLAVGHGTTVSSGRLIEAVWDGTPPPKARETLRTYVARLRRGLEAAGVTSSHDVLQTAAGGYRLSGQRVRLDAHRVEDAIVAARLALDHGEASAAAEGLRQAAETWRGGAYGAFGERPWARPEALRLDELRVTVEELRARALTAAGELDQATALAVSLVTVHPLRESAVELLVHAHCRAGRQPDALAAIDDYCGRLDAAAGLRPSLRVQRLVAAVRNGDASLTGARTGPHTRDTHREDEAAALGTIVRAWLEGRVKQAGAAVRRTAVLDADVRHRLGRCLRLLSPTDGLVRLLGTECARAWARSPDLAERCLVSLDAYALSRHPDGLQTVRREVDEDGLDARRALRTHAFATMHRPLGDGFADAVDALWAASDPVLQVEARRLQVVLEARRGRLEGLPELLDAYETAAARAGVDAARDFARTSRIVLRLGGTAAAAGPVVNGIASSTIKNAVLDLATLWRELSLGDVGPMTQLRVRALRHAGLTPHARDALLGYAGALAGDRATAVAMRDRLVDGLATLPHDPFRVLTIVTVLRTAEVLGDTDGLAVATGLLARERPGETLGVWPLDLVLGAVDDVVAGAHDTVPGVRTHLPASLGRGAVGPSHRD